MDARHRRTYAVVNTCSAPLWLLMILAPRARVTRWTLDRVSALFVALGLTYDALLVTGAVRSGRPVDFRDPAAVQAAFGQAETFLAGWTHYIAFDLFVGRWIWADANASGHTARLALLLTWLAGPAGLSLHLLRR